MNFDPIVEEYFETHAELLNEIKSFESKRSFKLLSKLAKDKDEMNFFSWLAEVRFGLFFDKICTDLKNDCPIDGKTPDWTITMNDQKIIAEVLRINTPEEEYRESISKARQLRKFQKENPGVPFIVSGPAKTISIEYLGGSQSKLVKKEERYREVIQKYKLPFIICVAPTIDTFLFELDFSDFLLGSRGFFKRNENFNRNVTGLLLNTPFSQYFYYPNEDAEYKLAEKNHNHFQSILYAANRY